MNGYRHHHAVNPAVILILPEAGSPNHGREVKPLDYKRNSREHWRPQRAIPVKRGKAEALRRFVDSMQRQDQSVRAFMAQAKAASREVGI